MKGTSTKSNESMKQKNETRKNKKQNKNDKNKGTIAQSICQKEVGEEHSMERVWYIASRELFDTLPGSKSCTQTHGIYNSVLSGFQASLSTQLMSLRESLGWSNQRDSKTSQACYSHPRRNLNLVCFFRFSLPLPVFGTLFISLYPRAHKPTAPFTYFAIPDLRVKCGGAPVPCDAK